MAKAKKVKSKTAKGKKPKAKKQGTSKLAAKKAKVGKAKKLQAKKPNIPGGLFEMAKTASDDIDPIPGRDGFKLGR
jgi:hypothetical protein